MSHIHYLAAARKLKGYKRRKRNQNHLASEEKNVLCRTCALTFYKNICGMTRENVVPVHFHPDSGICIEASDKSKSFASVAPSFGHPTFV